MAWLTTLACTLVLALNVLRLPFLWDDFDFLGRALVLRARDLLPDPAIVFYRPLSREIYFWVIARVLGSSPVLAHLVNAAVVAGILALTMAFVRRFAGSAAGLFAGFVLACSAAIPLGIGWISADQDLLCGFFVLVALHCLLRRRSFAGAAAMAAALLAKETAIAAVPAVVALAAVRRPPSKGDFIRTAITQGCVAIGWAAAHPWVRSIASGAAAASDREYIAFHVERVLPSMVQGAAITLNDPWIARSPAWPGHLLLPAFLATLLVFLALRWKSGLRDAGQGAPGAAILVGSLILFGTIALTSLVLGRWSPHYACIPAIGLSMVAGPLLARAPRPIGAALVLVYLWLGVGLRGNPVDPVVPSEPNFTRTAAALQKVESGFMALHPTLPQSNVYVSVQARGEGGLYRHLYRFQPLRVWYRQPGIWVLDPNRRRPGSAKEFLFWIAPNLAVYEIRLPDLTPRGPARDIDLSQYQKTLRGYAYGLAGAGEVDRAVAILTGMPETSREVAAFDRRSAAMLLDAVGRAEDATRLAATAPDFPRALATEAVVALLAEPVLGLDLDRSAMRAFGLDPGDSLVVRQLMHRFYAAGYAAAAGRFAARLQNIRPGDAESESILERARQSRPREITEPIPYDVPQ